MKTAIVTGATGNMGQAVVQKLLEAGFRVFGTTAPNDPVKPEAGNPDFITREVNLLEEAAAGNFVKSVANEAGTIDAAVLTVGGFAMGDIAATTAADILHQYKLNFETAYHIARPVFLQMKQQGKGRIFLVGSRPGDGMQNSKGMVAYGLSKSLIFRLAELLNDEATGTNVVTSVIVPSTIDTPQNRKSMPDADFSKWVKPEQIGEAVSFYCSEAAAAIRQPVIRVYNNS